jgi:hypothetical protein
MPERKRRPYRMRVTAAPIDQALLAADGINLRPLAGGTRGRARRVATGADRA